MKSSYHGCHLDTYRVIPLSKEVSLAERQPERSHRLTPECLQWIRDPGNIWLEISSQRTAESVIIWTLDGNAVYCDCSCNFPASYWARPALVHLKDIWPTTPCERSRRNGGRERGEADHLTTRQPEGNYITAISHTHTRAHARMCTHMCTSMCTRTHTYTHTRTRARTRSLSQRSSSWSHFYVNEFLSEITKSARPSEWPCTQTHTYKHTHTHTYTHTHTCECMHMLCLALSLSQVQIHTHT